MQRSHLANLPRVPCCGATKQVDPEETTSQGSESDFSLNIIDPENLRLRVTELEACVAAQQAEIDIKDKQIQSLQAQLLAHHHEHHPQHSSPEPNLGRCTPPNTNIVDEVQKWLFLEGGDLRDVPSLLTEYCQLLRNEMGLPLDRLFVAGMMLPPEVSAYVWKWESNQPQVVDQHEVPHEAFEKPNYNPDEPFAVLMEGRAMEYRMKACTKDKNTVIPPGCSWFTKDNYRDYFALPIYHRGEFKGAMAWSSKAQDGFTKDHIDFFSKSLAALSTVLRCQTNEIVMSTLMGRLQDQVDKRTNELATANTQLAQANQQIRQNAQNQLKTFACMSHELRTPLNCIVGLSHLLVEDTLPEEHRESIEMIATSSDLLLAVVNDVLDYSRLETESEGLVQTQIQATNLRQHLKTVVAALTTQVQQAELELRYTVQANVPEVLETDGRRLQQILYNLLGNAVKFGKTGKFIDFSVGVLETKEGGESKDCIEFSVTDYGKGIKEEEQRRIFEPFQQASTNETQHGGTGLGLAISRKLTEVLGGTISVKSEYGKYTRFCVVLPVEHMTGECRVTGTSDAPKAISSTTIEPSSDTRQNKVILPATAQQVPVSKEKGTRTTRSVQEVGADACSLAKQIPPTLGREQANPKYGRSSNNPVETPQQLKCLTDNQQPVMPTTPMTRDGFHDFRVLIAEDNLVNVKVLTRMLQRLGIADIDVVGNGQLAVDSWDKKNYKLIFMDLQMPLMDGIEATRIITQQKAERSLSYPKVVFLTAHALQDYQDQAKEVGGYGFISKPFKPATIDSMLRTLVFGQGGAGLQ